MKLSTKKAIELSETRSKLNELAAIDSPTDEQRSEIATVRAKLGELDKEYRDALRTEDEAENGTETDKVADAETREREELRGKSFVGAWIEAALSGRQVAGAEAWVSAATKSRSTCSRSATWRSARTRRPRRRRRPAG